MPRSLRRRRLLALPLAASGLLLAAGAPRAASVPPAKGAAALPAAVMAAGKAIDPARLEGHVRTLADDKLEGRGTGTRGYDLAAQYVAEQMQALGLEPGGLGGYLQPVPFLRGDLKA